MTFTPERMAERRKGIGASEVPAIVGLSPWATPMDVWLSKQEGHTPEPETEAQRNGHRMEGPILEALSADIGLPVTRNDQIVWGKGRLFCTPDGYRMVRAARHWQHTTGRHDAGPRELHAGPAAEQRRWPQARA
ncbi:MAG: hypothetical protein EBR82_86705 [Caulobacteraceae bacterium]|nr:hypothetical protein [Caulobacteraceae bacterium]